MGFITISFQCTEELSEIVQALLGGIGYEVFLDNEEGFDTSIEKENYDQEAFEEVIAPFKEQVTYEVREEEKQNWNKLWESNYEPVEVADNILIRASFHQPEKEYDYEIVITPKMSFGTGHHPTTTLMLRNQLTVNHKDQTVADLGCGTGILAIMAMKLGATSVDACDIEDWSVENALENASLNEVDVNVTVGTVEQMPKKDIYDVVLANINRNVLLSEMPIYAGMLRSEGKLLLSGFYTEDLPVIQAAAEKEGLQYSAHKTLNNWVSAVFEKQ
ncbi:50S ribosomal protein L11 methyltransferase [Algivirga pacifica]|uniref:Ribosomal protein L11 methyltransferase n=1 Tax=Algivirga pacifica TaxID=1162670 RepID=A0ABP9DGZ4_9BACT